MRPVPSRKCIINGGGELIKRVIAGGRKESTRPWPKVLATALDQVNAHRDPGRGARRIVSAISSGPRRAPPFHDGQSLARSGRPATASSPPSVPECLDRWLAIRPSVPEWRMRARRALTEMVFFYRTHGPATETCAPGTPTEGCNPVRGLYSQAGASKVGSLMLKPDNQTVSPST